jgi:hypothetical protein
MKYCIPFLILFHNYFPLRWINNICSVNEQRLMMIHLYNEEFWFPQFDDMLCLIKKDLTDESIATLLKFSSIDSSFSSLLSSHDNSNFISICNSVVLKEDDISFLDLEQHYMKILSPVLNFHICILQSLIPLKQIFSPNSISSWEQNTFLRL